MASSFSVQQLTALFEPKSIAVFGASGRPDRPGFDTVAQATTLGWTGEVIPVTPNYTEIAGWRCVGDISEVENAVDLAVISSSSARMETDLKNAINAGIRSAILYANPSADQDKDLKARLVAMAKEAQIPLLGPNSIGYVNYSKKSVASWIPPTANPCGNVAGIIQSGTVFGSTTLTDPRVGYCFAAHPGQETSVSMANVIDYVLTLPQTRVITLYLEIIYDPEGLIEALQNANAKNIPVVVLKPGRSADSQSAIATHTGRLAASDDIINAVLQKYHCIRVNNTDELWTTLCLLSNAPKLGPGGISIIGDSGGMKALMIDEAQRLGVELVNFNAQTKSKLEGLLAADLLPNNPVDFWGGEEHLADHVASVLQTVRQDPQTAIAVAAGEFGINSNDVFTDNLCKGVIRVAKTSGKPIAACNYTSRQFYSPRIMEMHQRGIAVLDGYQHMISAIGNAMKYRDRHDHSTHHGLLETQYSEAQKQALDIALKRAESGREIDALQLLNQIGIPAIESFCINCLEDIKEIPQNMQWPLAIKTAEDHAHKTELDGVILDIQTPEQLTEKYQEISERLGQRSIIQSMAPKGQEIVLGMINDPQFGPLIMLGSGGVNVELLKDKIFVLCPIFEHEANAMIEHLDCYPLINGYRGAAALDKNKLVQCILALSKFCMQYSENILSIDINPLIVHPNGAIAVDGLIQTRNASD